MQPHINDLLAEGRVSGRVYTDPEVHEMEKQFLFGQAWIYIGHESQIKNRGDFLTSTIADQPVMAVRDGGGAINAFFNRCPHRGAVIARPACGHAESLQCSYHGWSFNFDGTLAAVPLASGYDGTAVEDKSQFGLIPLPRFESYRGFLFASLSDTGPDLKTYLGPIARNLDNMIERSPIGEIEVWGTPFKMIKRNNWKVYLENAHDGAHAMPTHMSSIRAAEKVIEHTDSEWTRLQAYIIAANSQTPNAMSKIAVNCYPYGHSEMMSFRKTRPDTPEQKEYEALLRQRVGKDGVEDILGVDRNNAVIYPTLSIQPTWEQLRLITPLGVNETLVTVWTFRIKGAPDWINKRIRTFSNTIHTPASLVRADDLENFERVQIGLGASAVQWTSTHRELAKEAAPQGESTAMSERYIRNQFDAWSSYMPTSAGVEA